MFDPVCYAPTVGLHTHKSSTAPQISNIFHKPEADPGGCPCHHPPPPPALLLPLLPSPLSLPLSLPLSPSPCVRVWLRETTPSCGSGIWLENSRSLTTRARPLSLEVSHASRSARLCRASRLIRHVLQL